MSGTAARLQPSELKRPSPSAEKWVLGGLAVLYNPISPVEQGSKLLGSVVNIATLVWFWRLDRRV
jgi:hypothetical protein